MVADKNLTTKSRSTQNWPGFVVGAFFFFIFPRESAASGGGPLIVLVSLSTWLLGFVPLLAIEALIYWRITRFPLRKAALDAFLVNLISFVLVFVFAPLIIAAIGLLSALLSGRESAVALAFTSWVSDSAEYFGFAIVMTVIWYLALLLLGALIESWLYAWLWANRDLVSPVSAMKVSILCNVPSAVISLIGGGLVWKDLFLL